MKRELKIMIAMFAIMFQLVAPFAMAADTAQGTMNISGNVPVVFSLTTRGIPGDLDLTPNVIVNDRLLGIVHLKYNVNMAHLYMYSDTATGVPYNGGTAYAFGTAFKFKIPAAGCTSVLGTYNALFTITSGATATDIMAPLVAGALTTGLEEDCQITASWGGTAAVLPLAGKYAMTVTFTMISI
jgi:hypothetical protein